MAASWKVLTSLSAKRSINPIHEALGTIKPPPNFQKRVQVLALGDPTAFPEFATHQNVMKSAIAALSEGTGNGYADNLGPLEARTALAKYYSNSSITLSPKDVFLDLGCTGAMITIINALAEQGDNLLVPSPGFPLYATICQNRGVQDRRYHLLPKSSWEADLAHMETLVNSRTKALVVVNPSNPCGSVYSHTHLSQLLAFAARHRLPVIADEVYGKMTFGDPFVSLGEIETEVPVFVLGGLAKRWLVPGWRVGWGVIFDRADIAQEARLGIFKVKNMTLHPTTFLCNAIPSILETVPQGFYHQIAQKLKSNADFLYQRISQFPCLTMNRPQGTMYALISVDLTQFQDLHSSQELAEKLAWEQGVVVMPGECFLSAGSFRVVLCNSREVLAESCDRIAAFLQVHLKRKQGPQEAKQTQPTASPIQPPN